MPLTVNQLRNLALPEAQKNPDEGKYPEFWVFGLEMLERQALSFFVSEVLGSLAPTALRSRAEIENWIAAWRSQSDQPYITDTYELLTRRLIRSVRKRPDDWYQYDNRMFAHITGMDVEHSPRYQDFMSASAQERNTFTLTLRGQTFVDFGGPTFGEPFGFARNRLTAFVPNSGLQDVTIVYHAWYERDEDKSVDILCLPHVRDTTVRQIPPDESWEVPPVQRIYPVVYRNFPAMTRMYMPMIFAHGNGFSELLNTLYDWIRSNDAPKNLKRLDPLDAVKLARKWHEKRATPVARTPLASRYPGIQIHEISLVSKSAPCTGLGTPADLFTQMNYRLIWQRDDWYVFSLESSIAFQEESRTMDHCIGRSTRYISEKMANPNKYIPMTLRKREGNMYEPFATFDYYTEKGFTQLKGKQNQTLLPEATVAMEQFFNDLLKAPINYCGDSVFIQVKNTEGKFFGLPEIVCSYLHRDTLKKEGELYDLLSPKFNPGNAQGVGQVVYDPRTMTAYRWDGANWIQVTIGGPDGVPCDNNIVVLDGLNGIQAVTLRRF